MPSNGSNYIEISGIQVQVNRKAIKNLHLSVLPQMGEFACLSLTRQVSKPFVLRLLPS